MAKHVIKIGYAEYSETSPGVWEEKIVEHKYFATFTRISRRLQTSENLNDNITVSNEISIIADPYANQNFHSIRYAEWMGTKWKISNVEVSYPRLTLTLGGVFNA